LIVDYHMHLRAHAEGEEGPIEHTVDAVERYVETAQRAGVDEIGFTEHVYYFREFAPLFAHAYYVERVAHDLDSYCDVVVEAKRQGLPVKLGLEVDWFPEQAERLAAILEPYPWDYLLGSVHLVDGAGIWVEEDWREADPDDVWRRYFGALRGLAESGVVDVLAHADYVKTCGLRPSDETREDVYDAAADAIASAAVAFEVSTRALRTRRELYPAPSLLERLAERSVPATLASDAHVAHGVGRDFETAVAALRDAGYETVTVFDARTPHQAPLG
jgi:histidinol-phosphatase (PHP family)